VHRCHDRTQCFHEALEAPSVPWGASADHAGHGDDGPPRDAASNGATNALGALSNVLCLSKAKRFFALQFDRRGDDSRHGLSERDHSHSRDALADQADARGPRRRCAQQEIGARRKHETSKQLTCPHARQHVRQRPLVCDRRWDVSIHGTRQQSWPIAHYSMFM